MYYIGLPYYVDRRW